MGFPAGAGGATIGSPAGGVFGSLLGGAVQAPKQPNFTHTYDDVQGMVQGVQIAAPGPQPKDILQQGPYKGMNSAQANFLQRYGKPYGSMTPEEQNIVASGGDLPMSPTPMPTPGLPYTGPRPTTPTPMPTPTPITPRPSPMPTPVTPRPSPIFGGKGGTSVSAPAPVPASPSAIAPASQSGFNVNRASAQALQQAMGGTMGAMTGPLRIGQYMNPYTQNVIDRTQQDIERQRQMAANQLGAQASAAGAFGGSRQGVAEGVLAGEYGRMGADIAAQQRQSGYSQAMQSAMADRAARLGAAQQLGGLGQQAFGTGQAIQQQQMQQGLLQQGLQQQLIDAARGQYAGYTGAPMAATQAPLAALGVAPVPQSQVQSAQPGLFDYLKLPFMFASM